MIDLKLEQGSSITTMLWVGLAAILLTGLFYYRAYGNLKRGQWQLLLILRSIAIAIVVVLLFRPVMSYRKEQTEKPTLVFLLDRSRSMSIADDASGMTRFNMARQQVEKWWARLKDDFELRLVQFAETPKLLKKVEELAPLVPDGSGTSLSAVLDFAHDQLPKQQTGAIIVLTDGIHNTGRGPLEVTRRLGTPVYTVGVGATLRSNSTYRDIQVVGVDCPDRMMLNNKAKISAAIEAIGLGGHVCKVILEDNGQPIQETELTLDDLEGAQKVDFEFLPTVKGRHIYTVRVPPAASEKIVENNQRSAVSLVIEPGLRVLYLEGSLRAEYGAIVDRFLSKDPDLEFCAVVQTRKNVFQRRTNMKDVEFNAIPTKQDEINRFDVFIFGDIDSSFIKNEQQEMIVKRVKEGSGLIMLGGYHSLGPGGYSGTPIGDILPLELGSAEIGQINDSFVPTLTPAGANHPIFANVVNYFPTKLGPAKTPGLPMLDGCTRVIGPTPNAEVLAIHNDEGKDVPVMAVRAQVGKGRSAAFTADTTRKWQQGPAAFNQESPFLQFWGQVVRWLAGRAGDVKQEASVSGSTDKGFYEPEQTVNISAVVRDAKGEGTNKAKVTAKITGPGDRPDMAEMAPGNGPDGHYAGTFMPKNPGTYKLVLEAKIDDVTIKSDAVAFEMGRPNLEFEKLDLDEKLLTRIAADTGGRYVHISTADRLVDQLDKTQQKKQLFFEQQLYFPPLLWIVFVSALSLEWFLRKKFQLR